MTLLVVDAANVVGARPDGWWRDRAGATVRLLDRLALLVGRDVPGPDGGTVRYDVVTAVVEGAARNVAGPAGVRLVRAAGSGDDAIVELVGRLVGTGSPLVVTADRGLRARLPHGTDVTGPRWLLARLDELGDGSSSGEPRGGPHEDGG
jgi:hypothetical protein